MGKLIIFSAPSGSGKTTIVRRLLDKNLPLEFSISACNRQKRLNEKHANDYYFLSTEEFKHKIEQSDFVEWEEVYPGQYYGTLKSEINRIWKEGKHVVFDIDVVGGLNIKKQYKDKALAIFIMSPSIKELEKRLISRSTDDENQIKKRLDKAEYELSFAPKFDKIIVNVELEKAIKEAEEMVVSFLNIKTI